MSSLEPTTQASWLSVDEPPTSHDQLVVRNTKASRATADPMRPYFSDRESIN